MGKKVLFFGDFGIDDIAALIYADYEEEIDVVGVVSDYGNIPREKAMETAAFIRYLSGKVNIPIIAGATRPLTGRLPKFFPEIHGIAGMGPIQPGKIEGAKSEPFYQIYQLIEQYGEELTIVNTGRLSSLATSFVLYPEVMNRVKEYYFMGGAFFFPGNVTPVAEANFYEDPYAAQLILSCISKVNIIPLNVTQQAIIRPELIDYIHRRQPPQSIGALLKPMLDYYYDFYKKTFYTLPGPPLHDVVTLWATVNAQHIHYQEAPVRVVTDSGECFGQSIADFRVVKEKAKYRTHRVALGFNYNEFINGFVRVMTAGSNVSDSINNHVEW